MSLHASFRSETSRRKHRVRTLGQARSARRKYERRKFRLKGADANRLYLEALQQSEAFRRLERQRGLVESMSRWNPYGHSLW